MELENVFDSLMLAELEGEKVSMNGRKVEVLPKSEAFRNLGKIANYSLTLDPFGDGEGLLHELEPAAKKLRPKPEIAVVLDCDSKGVLAFVQTFHIVDDDAKRRRYAFFDLKGNERHLEVIYEQE